MQIPLVKIGNSKGIRLPKALLEQCQFTDAIELTAQRGRLILSKPRSPRSGWDEAFAELATRGEEQLHDLPAAATDWDRTDWEW